MRAVVVDRWLEPGELSVSELPDPEVGPGRLLIEVEAAGCNFFDILMVQGRYQVKPAFPFVPGAEASSPGTACSPRPVSAASRSWPWHLLDPPGAFLRV
jgi:hypothetical protein